MKKCSSKVWRFFDRLADDSNRCVGVVCKLCETQYKYFGNTTNLRVHLINKHPIQWELGQNGQLDDTHFRVEEEVAPTPKTKKSRRITKDKNVDVLENSASDNDGEDANATINLVRQMHTNRSDEEWLDDDPYQITHIETYEPKPKRKRMKYQKIKREVTSPTGLPGYYVAPHPENTVMFDDIQKKDEYSVFGEYVANKLRKIKAPRTRGNLQQLITTILWQAEYGMYDDADAVKRVLMFSVQTSEQEAYRPQQMQTVHIAEEVIEQTTEEQQQTIEGEIIDTN